LFTVRALNRTTAVCCEIPEESRLLFLRSSNTDLEIIDTGDWEIMSSTTILLADDHVLTLEALVHLLREDFNIIGTARHGRRVVELARKKGPEVIVMNIAMPFLNGIDAMQILQKENSSSKILFLARHMDLSLVEEALRAGAAGLVLKVCEPAELVKAIQSVVKGTTYVTPMVAGNLLHLYRGGWNATSGELPSVD
jgi:DNA-binding NarL/FixJ family response regulator